MEGGEEEKTKTKHTSRAPLSKPMIYWDYSPVSSSVSTTWNRKRLQFPAQSRLCSSSRQAGAWSETQGWQVGPGSRGVRDSRTPLSPAGRAPVHPHRGNWVQAWAPGLEGVQEVHTAPGLLCSAISPALSKPHLLPGVQGMVGQRSARAGHDSAHLEPQILPLTVPHLRLEPEPSTGVECGDSPEFTLLRHTRLLHAPGLGRGRGGK